MRLLELVRYAREKYHIEEQYKWTGAPGFSVLCHPENGSWIALLMRYDDGATEQCDIKCGISMYWQMGRAYLSAPHRMGGFNWMGVAVDERTEPEVVFALFDRAVTGNLQPGTTIAVPDAVQMGGNVYRDTPLPPPPPGSRPSADIEPVPKRIRRMFDLYCYGDGSAEQRAQNFYRQGRYMESYKDDAPWDGEYHRYFTTYHDLNVPQLRGYFTWRTRVRKGEFTPIATSLAYIYLYELLCGIGVASPEAVLDKLGKFETGFLDSGIGDPAMRPNLCRWRFEYAVIHDLPPETVRSYAMPAMLKEDDALGVLKTPEAHSDAEIYTALGVFAGGRMEKSVVFKKDPERARRLFAGVWRQLSRTYSEDGRRIFTACFGRSASHRWYPLQNAVYWEKDLPSRVDLAVNSCRSYHLQDGVWRERRYVKPYFNRDRLQAVVREADRVFRLALKTGYYLKPRPEEAWVTPYAEAAMAAEHQRAAEAARAEIRLDFAELGQIRRDALETMDSLLTEADTAPDVPEPGGGTPQIQSGPPAAQDDQAALQLDDLHRQILQMLIQREPAEAIIREHHLMPQVVADTINEAMFDAIGDNIVECGGSQLELVEDYLEDIQETLEGKQFAQ